MVRCNKHNVEENAKIDLDLIFGKYGVVGACRCEECKTIYIDASGPKSGYLGTLAKSYKLFNKHECYEIPKELYVLNHNHFKKLPKILDLISVDEFTIKNYGVIRLFAKYDPENARYYISKSFCSKKLLELIDKLEIRLIYVSNINKLDSYKNIIKLPNLFYVLHSKDLKQLESKITLQGIESFVDKNGNIRSIHAKYSNELKTYYISEGLTSNLVTLL